VALAFLVTACGLTNTSGAKIDVNMDAVAYLDPGQHGATV
jgi:hypothetical protein